LDVAFFRKPDSFSENHSPELNKTGSGLLIIKNNNNMNPRILQKISRNGLLSLIAISTLAFASCSRSLTSLQNSKKMQNQEVLVSPTLKHEKQIVVVPQIQNPESEIIPQTNPGLAIAPAQKSMRNVSTVSKTSVLVSKIASVKTQVLNKVENQVTDFQNLTKNSKVASYKHQSDFGFGMVHRGIVLIIIGVILIVLAVLLPWPLGELFYIIGAIFLIVGILDLLFGLLRSTM